MDEATQVQEARAVLEADRIRRSNEANAIIRAVLEQHGCDLVATPHITADGRIMADIRIVAVT
jgi:hypothetical protein